MKDTEQFVLKISDVDNNELLQMSCLQYVLQNYANSISDLLLYNGVHIFVYKEKVLFFLLLELRANVKLLM